TSTMEPRLSGFPIPPKPSLRRRPLADKLAADETETDLMCLGRVAGGFLFPLCASNPCRGSRRVEVQRLARLGDQRREVARSGTQACGQGSSQETRRVAVEVEKLFRGENSSGRASFRQFQGSGFE